MLRMDIGLIEQVVCKTGAIRLIFIAISPLPACPSSSDSIQRVVRKVLLTRLLRLCVIVREKKKKVDLWPDGTPVSEWFKQATPATLESLGKQYVLTEHGVKQDSTLVQTEAIQAVIDKAARSGEKTVVVVPQGTFLSGALFMRQGPRE